MNPGRLEGTSSDLVKNCLSELGPKPYTSVDLMSFTTDFLETNKIGSGGYGKVYKGQFPSGTLIAVKVLENMEVVEDTFMAEVRTMGKAFHRNLVKLHGYCFEDNMKALVFEYMENGSLDKILYENHHSDISWERLYGVAIEIAKGLNYLHNDLDEQIIHHDIKAANVLLDKNFTAKIADFGLAKIMDRDVSHVDVTRIRGTAGYNAPETWMPSSQVTFKCDVYSFGMMLFEILGKRSNGVGENWFPGLVWKQFINGNLEQFTKYCGIAEKNKGKAIILSKVALCCAHYRPERRPTMMEVVLMLNENFPIRKPSYPFLPGQFLNSSIVPSQDGFLQVFLEVPPARSEREQSDSMELDPIYPQNIIAGPTHPPLADDSTLRGSGNSVIGGGNNGSGGDGGVALPQLKSIVTENRSPNMLKEDLATYVYNKGLKLPTTTLVGKTTARRYSEMLLQWIAKDEAVTIGVHGMGGVGKTTILKDVYNQLLAQRNWFDKIIWVTVSQDASVSKLQNDIAKALGINLSWEDDEFERSRLLFHALERRKRIVVVLDDMWKEISLVNIGIPQPTQDNGWKILLTTRSLDVCQRMGCHEAYTIVVERLPADEAWELFMFKVDVVLTPEVREIAEMVAKECSGLPLAIITVGAAMRGKGDIIEWTVALNDLRREFSNRIMDMEDIVFERLKFSYDRLANEKLRKCFLCCALYPEDYVILARDLVDFWIMDGMIEGRNRQDELLEGQFILKKLKDHCLLESVDAFDDDYGETTDGVKMHDLIREMALRITSKCFMIKAGSLLRELSNEVEWEEVLERTSFMNSKITRVSISPRCPNISTLFLGGNALLCSIIHDFFAHMQCLRVLDLRCEWDRGNFKLESLPNSISDLVNLRDLRLSWCTQLKIVPSLSKLVLLERLELANTAIEELPEGIKMLANLRCLNLHAVKLREKISKGLISMLSALQELYLGGINVDRLYDVGSGELFAHELLSLKALQNLNVSFHCFSDYASYVGSSQFNGLKCFSLAIGQLFYYPKLHLGPPPRATLQLSYSPDERNAHNALFFPQNTKRIEIDSFNYLTRLKKLEWLIKDVRELGAFNISRCNKLVCIWWSSEDEKEEELSATSSTTWVQRLKTIEIFECPKLYTVFKGVPALRSIPRLFCLKRLEIIDCHNLKNVFWSSRLLQQLQNLEVIILKGCKKIEGLIRGEKEESSSAETPIALPRLIKLGFWNLPKLKSIWGGVMICESLQVIGVTNCFELKRLPQLKGEEQSPQPAALKEIKGSRKWWDSLEWDPAYPKNRLQPFFKEWDPTYLSQAGQDGE